MSTMIVSLRHFRVLRAGLPDLRRLTPEREPGCSCGSPSPRTRDGRQRRLTVHEVETTEAMSATTDDLDSLSFTPLINPPMRTICTMPQLAR
jgi:hypothetical protein